MFCVGLKLGAVEELLSDSADENIWIEEKVNVRHMEGNGVEVLHNLWSSPDIVTDQIVEGQIGGARSMLGRNGWPTRN